MMEKYVFENKSTRYFRRVKKYIYLISTLFLAYLGLCVIFIVISQNQSEIAESFFAQKRPDLIVVFTGDVGRIGLAIQKAQEYKQSKILITGVYSRNTIESLFQKLGIPSDINSDQIEIDYHARNTIENVIATFRYLRDDKTAENILIISNDYHIMRIKRLINTLREKDDHQQFYFYGIKTDYKRPRNLKILFKEVFKLIKAYMVIFLWDHEPTSARDD